MTVTTDVTKDNDTITGRFTLALDEVKKPAFAFAGLADLAIEQVKDAPAAYVAEVKKAQERLAEVPTAVQKIPAQVKDLREQATDFYAQLAVRGQRLVTQIRRQPATEAAIVEGKEAVREAEAAVTAARSSAKAGKKAATGAAKKIG